MEKTSILLDPKDNPLFVKVLQILFGLVCFGVAIFWFIFNLKADDTDSALWITVALLMCFGLYQILSGFGKTKRYIEIDKSEIILKKNTFLPVLKMKNTEIRKIESLPLNIIFRLASGGKTILRFGINYPEVIIIVKDRLKEFSEINSIAFDTENDPAED